MWKEDIICVLSETTSNTLVPFIATQFIGSKYVCIEPSLPEEDLMYLFDYLQMKIIFVSEKFVEKILSCLTKCCFKGEIIVLGKSKHFVNLSQLMEITEGLETFQPIYLENLKEDAAIILSSGTTGKPKGIRINHYALLVQTFTLHFYCCKGNIKLSNYTGESKDIDTFEFMSYSPLHWISGVQTSLAAFFCGGKLILGTNFDTKEAWIALKRYKPNIFFLPPGQANEFCSYVSDKEPLTNLYSFWTGGGLVTEAHIQNMRKCFPEAIITQVYGLTENTGIITGFDINKPEEFQLSKKFPSSCGKPTFGVQIRIVDPENETVCGVGIQGELRTKNEFFMNGYYKMDSSSVFDSDGWLKTGDLAYFDENRCIFIVDRIKDLLLYKIHNIKPSIIEHILSEHPAVHESLVIGYPHPQDNEHPMGIVVLKDEYKNKISAKELITYVNEKVPSDRYKIRAGIKFVDQLLKTVTGKPKKWEMRRLIINGLL
ncbi:hypothetical protein WA026_020108 [Henosepilachna vigintioctopunctata]|uniref:Uncharacterized protein n=1 Tax=Henosepilachna vigintioctopunctata TaxID=420089 RepID=A0AAW1UAY7_9CUCU